MIAAKFSYNQEISVARNNIFTAAKNLSMWKVELRYIVFPPMSSEQVSLICPTIAARSSFFIFKYQQIVMHSQLLNRKVCAVLRRPDLAEKHGKRNIGMPATTRAPS